MFDAEDRKIIGGFAVIVVGSGVIASSCAVILGVAFRAFCWSAGL